VDRILRKHGGSIWAESGINQGATFYFTVPGLEGINGLALQNANEARQPEVS
jgi:signal transduction histidine kinase